MGRKEIITNQKIVPAKLELARSFRSQMTPEEKILWEHLRNNKLEGFHFRRQQIIQGYIADFYCHTAGLVVEVDGGVHKLQHEYDQERDVVFSDIGLRVIRISNLEVMQDLTGVITRIMNFCKAAQNN